MARYFCKYRTDLKNQRRESQRFLERQRERISPHLTPSPDEMHALAHRLDLSVDVKTSSKPDGKIKETGYADVRDKTQKNAELVVNGEWLSLTLFRHAYNSALQAKHDGWRARQRTFEVEWSQLQQKYLAMLTAPEVQNKPQRAKELQQEKAAQEEKLRGSMKQLQTDYQRDVQGFCERWQHLIDTEHKLDWLEQHRQRQLEAFFHNESKAIKAQYRARKRQSAEEQRNRSATLLSGGSPQQQVHVLCTHKSLQHEARVTLNPEETVAQFAYRLVTREFGISLQPSERVWAFIVSGPRLRDELPLRSYNLAHIPSSVKLVVVDLSQVSKTSLTTESD